MQYLLLIYNNPTVEATEKELEALVRGHATLYRELAGAGKVVSSASLADQPVAATVRIRDGVPVATDGPFLEAKEYLAGYYQVECESLDEATEIAGRIPCAPHGFVEILAVNEAVTQAVRDAAG